MAGALYLWLLPGRSAPAGYRRSGVVSRWQDTGRVRAALWEAPLFDDVRPCGDPTSGAGPTSVLTPEAATAPPAREFLTVQERNT